MSHLPLKLCHSAVCVAPPPPMNHLLIRMDWRTLQAAFTPCHQYNFQISTTRKYHGNGCYHFQLGAVQCIQCSAVQLERTPDCLLLCSIPNTSSKQILFIIKTSRSTDIISPSQIPIYFHMCLATYGQSESMIYISLIGDGWNWCLKCPFQVSLIMLSFVKQFHKHQQQVRSIQPKTSAKMAKYYAQQRQLLDRHISAKEWQPHIYAGLYWFFPLLM